jgi:hypothetical protein
VRRIIVLFSMLLLCAGWAGAQYGSGANTPSSDTTPATVQRTIQGCLDGSDGNFTLTDTTGATYQLTGKTEGLSAHVGHTIRVTGVTISVLNVPGSMSAGTAQQPSMSVESFKHVKAYCDGTTGSGAY